MSIEYTNQDARKYREENTIIRVDVEKFSDYDKEACLSIAHNGRQFTRIALSENEAKIVIGLLNEFFCLPAADLKKAQLDTIEMCREALYDVKWGWEEEPSEMINKCLTALDAVKEKLK